MGQISYCVCSWQAFTAKCSVCGYGQGFNFTVMVNGVNVSVFLISVVAPHSSPANIKLGCKVLEVSKEKKSFVNTAPFTPIKICQINDNF
jgi:hypothetical protein